jgi:hypothetical protein
VTKHLVVTGAFFTFKVMRFYGVPANVISSIREGQPSIRRGWQHS